MYVEYGLLRRRIREEFGSQQQFAEHLGINPKTLSFKLKEKGRFTQKEIFSIAEALHLSSSEVVSMFFMERDDCDKNMEIATIVEEIHELKSELRKVIAILSAGRRGRQRWMV